MFTAIPLILSALTLADGALLRRNRAVRGFEFGRFLTPKEDAEAIFRENGEFRFLVMSFDATMSLDNAMSFDTTMSMPFDTTMSMPFDTAMSFDTTMSIPAPDAEPAPIEATPDCDADLPSIPVSLDFEVEPTDGSDTVTFLTNVLSNAIEQDFTLCSTRRHLSGSERMLEDTVSNVRGVKIVDAKEVAEVTCGAAESNCVVVDVDNEVLYEHGTSSDAAKDEFLEKLASQLEGVEGVRERDTSTSPSGSSNEATDGTEGEPTPEGLSAAHMAMVSVLSVAAVSVALVMVQRRLARRRDDDKSVVSEDTFPNTTYDTSPLNHP